MNLHQAITFPPVLRTYCYSGLSVRHSALSALEVAALELYMKRESTLMYYMLQDDVHHPLRIPGAFALPGLIRVCAIWLYLGGDSAQSQSLLTNALRNLIPEDSFQALTRVLSFEDFDTLFKNGFDEFHYLRFSGEDGADAEYFKYTLLRFLQSLRAVEDYEWSPSVSARTPHLPTESKVTTLTKVRKLDSLLELCSRHVYRGTGGTSCETHPNWFDRVRLNSILRNRLSVATDVHPVVTGIDISTFDKNQSLNI